MCSIHTVYTFLLNMNIKKLLRYHKNNITAVFGIGIFLVLTWQWLKGEFDFVQYGSSLGVIAGAIATLSALISSDGKTESQREEDKQALITQIKEQLKNEQHEKDTSCTACGDATDCKCVLKTVADVEPGDHPEADRKD